MLCKHVYILGSTVVLIAIVLSIVLSELFGFGFIEKTAVEKLYIDSTESPEALRNLKAADEHGKASILDSGQE